MKSMKKVNHHLLLAATGIQCLEIGITLLVPEQDTGGESEHIITAEPPQMERRHHTIITSLHLIPQWSQLGWCLIL